MQAFICFHLHHPFDWLAQTLDEWDKIPGIVPEAMQCPFDNFEVSRRVAVEGVATGDYILVDIGALPVERHTVSLLRGAMKKKVGMVTASREDGSNHNVGVRLCRKGVVKRWPSPELGKPYDQQHSEAYKLEGFDTIATDKVHFKWIPLQ